MACLRNVYFERINILADERHLSGIIGRNSEFPPTDDSEGTGTRSCADNVRMEIGLAGAFAEYLHVGGFTPGRDALETYTRAINACLKFAEDDAGQCALGREVKHGNSSVGQNLMDEVLSSPYARDILFDVSDYWHRLMQLPLRWWRGARSHKPKFIKLFKQTSSQCAPQMARARPETRVLCSGCRARRFAEIYYKFCLAA
jgi:hypothetical protein